MISGILIQAEKFGAFGDFTEAYQTSWSMKRRPVSRWRNSVVCDITLVLHRTPFPAIDTSTP
jgi:hypothetical protein